MALNLKTIAGGLLLGLGLATTGSAGTISFLDIADGAGFTDSNGDLRIGGEADWNTIVGSGIGIRDITTGISVVGTATRSDGGTSALAYFDRNTAGLGVCSVLTSSGQCNPSNDDNVGAIGGSDNAGDGTFETLVLTFSEKVKISDLMFRAEGHGPFTGSVKINGTDTSITGGMLVTSLIGDVFNFQYLPVSQNQNSTNEFYIEGVTISAVPLPAAGLLMLGGLGGLAALRRRKRVA